MMPQTRKDSTAETIKCKPCHCTKDSYKQSGFMLRERDIESSQGQNLPHTGAVHHASQAFRLYAVAVESLASRDDGNV